MSGDARTPVRRALVSVSDKTGLVELAAALHDAGVRLVSTGSTAATIARSGIPVTPVEEVTGFPECLDGRVKTLHPAVHAGLLADRRNADHAAALERLEIEPFDLLVVNLYPFAATVAMGSDNDACVEQIDIGGPAMVRAAAKNHGSVAVVVDPSRYPWLVDRVRSGGFTLPERQRLAAAAFRHTAAYDIAVASWLGGALAPDDDGTGCPAWLGASWRRADVLRYGENPHQRAALYVPESGIGTASGLAGAGLAVSGLAVSGLAGGGLAGARQLHGWQMSFNNYVDAEAAVRAAYDHTLPCVAIVKHTNPCGIAVSTVDDIAQAHARAHACDPISAFGGVIAANRPVSRAMAEQVAEVFTEVVVAPGYEDGAVDVLARKKNVRILVAPEPARVGADLRPVSGGLLVQDRDALDAPGDDPAAWTLACGTPVAARTLADLAFAWRACRAVKSNAIVVASAGATVGVGMGQVNRVDAARLAVTRGGDRCAGAVAASDAFFPFPDGLRVLLDAGVRAVVQPGGSVRDAEVIEAAKAAGAALYLTGTRHFTH